MQSRLREVVAAAALFAACRERPIETKPAALEAGKAEAKIVAPAQKLVDDAIADALTKVEGECLDRPAYLALRGALIRVSVLARRSAPVPFEVVFGPPIVRGEVAGSLGELDRALAQKDCAEAKAARYQITQALTLAANDLARHPADDRTLLRNLSDAAYQLGAEALESSPTTPEGADAVLVDVRSILAAIRAASLTLPEGPSVTELLNALEIAPLTDRATFAVRTGKLGLILRERLSLPPPYAPLVPRAPISALTLPSPHGDRTPAIAALGGKLFADVRLSRGKTRACSTCHVPSRAFSDGLPRPTSLDASLTLDRNVPTLLYAPLAAVLHWDGSIRTADAQALHVIHARAEMGLDDRAMLAAIASESSAFSAVFSDGLTTSNIGRALAAYQSLQMVPGKAKIDRFAAGEESALDPDLRAGLDVFAGKGRCARCHVPPTFGGARPPDFTAAIFGVLGVPKAPGSMLVDPDRGRALVTGKPADEHAFRTPTLRNVDRTAPYFHHGAYSTLEQVVDFYDKGGGRGLGLDVPNQDPDVRPLSLTPEERRVLLLFLRDALRDP